LFEKDANVEELEKKEKIKFLKEDKEFISALKNIIISNEKN
jgi:hypothetical protein